MRKKYLIQWTSKVNGRIGQGSIFFDRNEADAVVSELNDDFPEIQHEVVEAPAEPVHPRGMEKKTEAAFTE